MIRSMTGYGEAERETPYGRLRAEVRTVNHRFFSVNLKLIRAAERYEPLIREQLRAQLSRGHVNFSLRLRPDGEADDRAGVRVDEARARSYRDALQALKSSLDLSGDVDLALLARYNDILTTEETSEEMELESDTVAGVTADAAAAVCVMREREGERLASDLEARVSSIEAYAAQVEELAPARLVSERDRLRRAIAELLEDIAVDEDRVAREVAFLAERWDVTEELVRIRAHIALFRELLAEESSEPVGKRLGFLVQELNREVNTIGSKANDAAIEHIVVSIKDEIERVREQVENVE